MVFKNRGNLILFECRRPLPLHQLNDEEQEQAILNSQFYIDFSLLIEKEKNECQQLIFDCSTSDSFLDINLVTVLNKKVPHQEFIDKGLILDM